MIFVPFAVPALVASRQRPDRTPRIVPLVGARTHARLTEALPAMELDLTADDLAEIEKAVPAGSARGDRYPSALMSGLGVRS
jgi:aryl-alcohol dehydrogenase-like predicted oxidoreductase